MMRKVGLIGAFAAATAWADTPLTEADRASLTSFRNRERLLYESYLQDSEGLAGVVGYNFDRYFSGHHFFELAIFGAVQGKRGGYGIAAFGLGRRFPLARGLDLDAKVAIGSGGGGGLKAGGGFAIHASTGIAVRVARGLFLDLRGGYLSFPTGPYGTSVLALGLSFENWEVELDAAEGEG